MSHDLRPVLRRPSAAPETRCGRGPLIAIVALAALAAGCSSPIKLDETPVVSRDIGGAPAAATTPPAAAEPARAQAVDDPLVASTRVLPQSRVASVELVPRGMAGASAGATDGAAGTAVDAAPVGDGRTVFFDYDSYVVQPQYQGVVDAQARRLNAAKSLRVTVEGHTDARGGSEYNLALGQKRAEAVVRALQLLGVDASRLDAVSYGRERPLANGQDEASFARNRRAELRDR